MKEKRVEVLRREYKLSHLDEDHVDKDPVNQFDSWMQNAVSSQIIEPNAMFLATCGNNGIPSGRIVLLKSYGEKGFVFFTNYESRKGRELNENPFAAITILWKEIERQVRIQGRVEKVSLEESDEYFCSRPLDSQISAIVSPQSQVIPHRFFLEERRIALEEDINKINRPDNWGGYRIIPFLFEFWQEREFRFHDRIQYRLSGDIWMMERLAP